MKPKSTLFSKKQTLNTKGKLIFLEKPLVQGILNLTSDSFYDGGKFNSLENAIKQVHEMAGQGVDIIDLGAQSTRPGAELKSAEHELVSLIPIIKKIKELYPELLISVDTFYAEVASKTVETGADIINDVSGGELDDKLLETVAKLQVPYVLMHSKGDAQTMNSLAKYDHILLEMINYFQTKLAHLQALGIKDVILDPGFGFAKTIDQNYYILKNLDVFEQFGLPILCGISRKSMIYKVLNNTPQEALNGTTVLNTFALQNGVNILRVHDVKEAKQTIAVLEKIK